MKYGKIYFSDKKDFSSEFTFRNCEYTQDYKNEIQMKIESESIYKY